jgi:hypothetical protein
MLVEVLYVQLPHDQIWLRISHVCLFAAAAAAAAAAVAVKGTLVAIVLL